MAEFIVNPRRAPRAPARCRAAVASAAGSFEAETEDIGARGCQIVSPRGVKKGETVRLAIASDKVPEPLRVSGKVAWVSARLPWRVGIAFDEAALPESTRWFERLVAAYPGMGSLRKVPERIAVDATVYLGAPPRFLVDFSADEALLLRAIGSGARVDELQARLRDRWPAMQRALFSLIARAAVTLVRGHAVHPDSWKRILGEIEAALAVEFLGAGSPSLAAPPEPSPSSTPVPGATPVPTATPLPAWPAAPAPRSRPGTPLPGSFPPATSRPGTPLPGAFPPATSRSGTPLPGSHAPAESPWGTPPQNPSPLIDLQDDGPPLEVAEPGQAPRGAARATDAGGAWGRSAHDPDFAGKGVGWRKPQRERSPEAQAVFERAHAEFKAGNVSGAIALLRRALSLAPGDPEIAEVLGKLAFRDRPPGSR
jgi:hypothetical protein